MSIQNPCVPVLPVQYRVASYWLNVDDSGTEIQFSSTSAVSAYLPPVTEAANGWMVLLRNIGTGTLTIEPNGSELIDGQSSSSLSTGQMRWIRCDGTGWKTISWWNGSGSSSSGSLIQSVFTSDGLAASGSETIPADNTIPQDTEGKEYISVDITPTSSTNYLVIEFVGVFSNTMNGGQVVTALFVDTSSDELAVTAVTCDNNDVPYTFAVAHQMLAGSTSTLTFSIRAGGHASSTTNFNSVTLNQLYGGRSGSIIRVSEIAA